MFLKVNMYIGNERSANMNAIAKAMAASASAPTVNRSLVAPMIQRIHGIRPGCGSCGR